MIVTVVTIQVKLEFTDDFIAATLENQKQSVIEKGNLRFDFLQCIDDPCRFMLYEAYASADDASAHKLTDHYLKWKEKVAPWMEVPRVGVAHHVIAPVSLEAWRSFI